MSLTVPELERASAEEVVAYAVERFHPRLTMACKVCSEMAFQFPQTRNLIAQTRACGAGVRIEGARDFETLIVIVRRSRERFKRTLLKRWVAAD